MSNDDSNFQSKPKSKSKSSSSSSCSCISHSFSRAASTNPTKIALLHAAGGSHLSQHLRSSAAADGEELRKLRPKPPPLYHGDRSFTYAQLLAAVDSLASRLRSFSAARAPTVIGIYSPPSADYVASVLSVLRCGAAFLPLDPSWPKARVSSIIASSNVALVIASKSLFGAEQSSNWIPESSGVPVLWFSLEEEEEVAGDVEGLKWPCESEEQRLFCYVMYTSGSTGKPKGVCGTEQGLLNRFSWMQELYPLSGDEVLLFKTPISFIDHLQEFLGAVLTACTLVIPPFNKTKKNMFSIVDFVQAYSIDRITAVPSLMRAIMPGLESRCVNHVLSSLKLLVLSGEVLPLSLWDSLSKMLPGTSILNLYGSTEVSGDCTYFDCERLPMILESQTLTSVPIGVPIANCDVVLVGDTDQPDEGEICVAGLCNSIGYYSDSSFVPLDIEKLPQDYGSCSEIECVDKLYFRTGDFARRLKSGDLVFLGRKDRTIKLNGQRISLEEIEETLRMHPHVFGAAVISHKIQEDGVTLLVAFVLLGKERSEKISISLLKGWMVEKLPLVMVPNNFIFVEAIPMTSSGKVDYQSLKSEFLAKHVQEEIFDVPDVNLLHVIKKAFCDVLMVEEIPDNDDFFTMGGNSISAAHLSNTLGIDMRLLYQFPSPSKLCTTLLERKRSLDVDLIKGAHLKMNLKDGGRNMFHTVHIRNSDSQNIGGGQNLVRTHHKVNENHDIISKRLKVEVNVSSEVMSSLNLYPWNTASISFSCSFTRCNKVTYEGDDMMKYILQENCVVPRNRKVSMQQVWKVYMGSCVDASPLIMFKCSDIYLFIGSHSHEFMCVNARSGHVQWKIWLEGRIECSAAILVNFSQVIVGCYKGKLYFIDTSNGNICWTFKTSGEVKSQPVVDGQKQLIWCGSHDHHLYALDYVNHCCVYKVPCGGSIFGSPVIDEVNDTVYVASTSGRVTAISKKAAPFKILWMQELEVPIFGSPALSCQTGYLICCLVDGHVLALDPSGSIVWKRKISGPVFSGVCISSTLPSQVLVCSRNGSIFSFEPEKGNIVWEYSVGDPITASAYVDEHLCLTSDPSLLSDRLVCVCSSSGSIILLRVTEDANVEEFARLELEGDVFSSPVVIGGRVFVGCRDDYVHCLSINV